MGPVNTDGSIHPHVSVRLDAKSATTPRGARTVFCWGSLVIIPSHSTVCRRFRATVRHPRTPSPFFAVTLRTGAEVGAPCDSDESERRPIVMPQDLLVTPLP